MHSPLPKHVGQDPAHPLRVVVVDREQGQLTVRLTAMRNELVAGIVALTKQAGLEIRAVELLEEALLRVRRLDASWTEPHARRYDRKLWNGDLVAGVKKAA